MTATVNPPDESNSTDTNATDAENPKSPDEPSYTDEEGYGCPHCEATHSDERLTRIHITRAEDNAHQNRNGLMPEEEIEVLDADGNVIERRSRRPDEIDLSTINTDAFPDDLSKKRQHVLVVGTRHPKVDSRRELYRLVKERLADDDFDVESPCEQTVGRAIDEFYHPQASGNTTEGEAESLSDLALKQQAIAITRLVKPEAGNSEIADTVGCATSYPGQVADDKRHVLSTLDDRLADGETPASIIKEEISVDALKDLLEQNLVTDLQLDLEDVAAEMEPADESSTAMGDQQLDDDEPETTGAKSQWGSPTDQHNVMRAAPTSPFPGDPNDEPTDETGTQRTLADADSVGATTDQSGETHRDAAATDDTASAGESDKERVDNDDVNVGAPDAGPQLEGEVSDIITELQLLQAKVAFSRRTVGSMSESYVPPAYVTSLAEQVEQHCKAILQAHNEV
jgi:hypothetical protein